MQKSTDESERTPRQFHLWTWWGVTLAAAILMGVAAILFRDLRHSHALWSLHALVAALPILGIFVVNASAVFEGRRLAIISLAIYGVAFAMPALNLGGDMTFGVEAFYFSFLGIELFGEWGSRDEHFWYPIACTIGILASFTTTLRKAWETRW